ncbi:sigma-70 family RNA polymerase sigma factor [Paraburkholderia nodosa]|uniref:sigma-70 family RNA polymerase sigma factor n=1 Tax=Paraburkholderia nodosa TaxID=392320 RepID=UPI00048699F3|nr:sigma-70 family RNA polymerase sigma factor [Paraburkholderia nodosa]
MPGMPTNLEAFESLLGTLRPRLHRYCARMTGSVIDGEDVVQDTLLNAYEARSSAGAITNVEAWLFRIAHNAAMDFLRRHARHGAARLPEIDEAIAAPGDVEQDREIAAASLHTFMHLAPPQRCAVILKDVLGYSLEEVGEVMETSLPAAKSALQRGRARLRELGAQPEPPAGPALAEAERSRLERYVACFNARDFDTLRSMLADDVQLDLVNRLRVKGRDKVGEYLHRYALAEQWRFEAACVDGRPVIVVFDRHDPAGGPAYFVALDFAGDAVSGIRDFLFARYVLDGAALRTV